MTPNANTLFKELRTVDDESPSLPAVIDANVSMFERLARDPSVDVDKLQQLMAMQERIMAINREAAFEAAFSKMQPEIPVIDEHGRIEVKGSLRSTYAPLEDIHDVIKPILAQHGFSIRHRTEWPADKPGIIRIVGILGHEQGHKEFTAFEAPMDRSDYRTDIQSQGSTVSYGRRYTTLDLLNISTRKADNDGRGKAETPKGPDRDPPVGYDAWLGTLEGIAANGMKEFDEAWGKSKEDYRKYLASTAPKVLASLKTKAAKAGVRR